MTCLKQDNDKLQCQVTNKSLGSSESSLNTSNNDTDPDKRMSVNTSYSDTNSVVTSGGGQPSSLDMSATTDPSNCDSKSISIVVEAPSGIWLFHPNIKTLKLHTNTAIILILNRTTLASRHYS